MNESKTTILLVEDEPVLRRVFRTLLEASGYRVREAGSAAQALQELAEESPALVLLDLGLPDRSGLDVARELKAAPDGTRFPVIAMTGRSGPDVHRAVLDAGCAGHLVKPIEPKELLRRIPEWLDRAPAATDDRAETLA